LPLSKSLFPNRSILRDLLLVLGGSLLMALLAQPEIKLPFSPVPITLQTLAVLLVGATLGSRLGFLAGVAYLLEGLVLPVFAGGTTWANPRIPFTLGFLLSFPLAAALVGYLVERYAADRNMFKALGAMLVANMLIYVIGLPVLGTALAGIGKYSGLSGLLAAGMTPFLIGDAVKAVLAALLLPMAWKLLGK
jgi:biotin transport system substrate-specific component